MFDFTALPTLVTAVPPQPPAFTSGNAMTALLTVESLLFAVFNVAIAASLPTATGACVIAKPKCAARGVASVMTIAGIGAAAAWLNVFDGWPDVAIGWVPSGAIGLAILVEPALAWFIVHGMAPDP